MCYHYSLKATKRELEKQYALELPEHNAVTLPIIHASAFDNIAMPVITPNGFDWFHWGLIPHWAHKISDTFHTANAKSETIHSKPTWKTPIESQRCLVPATGFFEWRHEGNQKYPYHIYIEDRTIFCFAGIWDKWTNPETKQNLFSFSILTVPANELMQKIHNTNKRMPLILSQEDALKWINDKTDRTVVDHIMLQPQLDLKAYTLHPDFANRKFNELLSPWEYPELTLIDLF